MKVLDQSALGAEAGSKLSFAELGLPIAGRRAALLVFWKRQ